MASIDSLQTLLVEQLKDIYDAERRLTKAIPKLIKNSTNEELVDALQQHLDETEEQVSRIEQAFEMLGERAKAKACKGMQGLIEEGNEHVGEDFEDDGLRDATIIGAAQRVEHYEIAAYGTAIAHARLLDLADVVNLLEQTLEEEKAADKKLTEIAESVVNLDAASQDEEEGEMEEEAPRRGGGQQTGRAVGGSRGSSAPASAADRARSRGRSSSRRR